MIRILLALSASILFSSQGFAAACPASSTSTATGAGFGTNCTVTDGTTGTVIQLNFYNGFSDGTAISAIDDNGGTTVGAQRKLSFIKAAEIIAAQVDTPQALLIDANFTNLSCNATSATLGSAGAVTNLANVTPTAGLTNTLYPVGLINAIGNNDYYGGSDVTAQFNSNIGNTGCLQSSNGWYYGFGTPAANYIGFTTVLLHEITHGLGFASLTNPSTGQKAEVTLSNGVSTWTEYWDDIFSNFLYDAANSRNWNHASENDANRAASAISSTGLLWSGTQVNTQAIGLLTAGFQDNDSSSSFTSGDKVQMYAPNPVEGGSSVSHFNTAAAPNELMEPQYTEGQYTLGLASYLLKDIGWTVVAPSGNTAPVLGSIGNKSAPVNTNLTVNLSATDAEGDTLTYSGCDAESTCSISSNTLTLGSNTVGSFSITIEVEDDGSPNLTDSETFTFTTYAEPELDINSTNLNPNDTLNISNSATSIDSYSLDFEGSAANDLVSVNGTSLSIAMPTSGQFAGEYVLTFTDANTGTTYDFTLVRDPRLVFSATKLLANHSLQTLKIEGGAANTVYTLASSDSALSFRKSGNAITNVTADGNAASFYQASLVLVTSDVSASTAVTASVSSVYNTVSSSGLTVEPVRSHVLTFENSVGNALESVTVTLDTSTLSTYNLTSTYTSNTQGQVTIALPANTTDYSATTSLSGYSNATVTLDDSLLTQTVVLEEITDPMSLSGNITALGDLSFATELPVITLVLNDGSEVNITPTLSSNTLVTFSYVHNLATGSVSSLKVTHSQGIGIIFNINTTGNVTFDIFMESSTQTITNGTKKAGSSGGGLGVWALAILLAGLIRRRQIKPRC
jgi:hypothetical protein